MFEVEKLKPEGLRPSLIARRCCAGRLSLVGTENGKPGTIVGVPAMAVSYDHVGGVNFPSWSGGTKPVSFPHCQSGRPSPLRSMNAHCSVVACVRGAASES